MSETNYKDKYLHQFKKYINPEREKRILRTHRDIKNLDIQNAILSLKKRKSLKNKFKISLN